MQHPVSELQLYRVKLYTLDEFRDKAADRTEWACLVEKLGETTSEVDDFDESTTEGEDFT